MQRPSVLFINRVYPPVRGASGRVLRDLARSFARDGWQVTVITTGPKAMSERDGAVRVIRVKGAEKPRYGLVYLWILLKLFWAAFRLPKTHLIITLTDPPFLAVVGHVLKKIKRNKHIHWCLDLYPDVFPALGVSLPDFIANGLKAMVRKAMRGAEKVVVIGRCMAERLSGDGFDAKQITVIPNWPDFELVEDGQPHEYHGVHDAEGVRKYEDQHKHGPRFRVLYAGNIGRAHPVSSIIDAAEILNDTHPDVEFVFVGDGPRHDFVNRERAKRHLDNIRLLPYQPASRLRSLMESGDVHLVSMDACAAGMIVPVKLYASIAANRPCVFVGPQNSEAASVIRDFKAGSIVAQDDSVALAEVIRQYRENSDKWFGAFEGAKEAALVFRPEDAIDAWIKRARSTVYAGIDGKVEQDFNNA